MDLKKLFVRRVPQAPTAGEFSAALKSTREQVARRDRRIAELTAQVEHNVQGWAEESSRQAAQVRRLEAQLGDRAGHAVAADAATQQDLRVAFELLDELDADAQRNQAAQERVAELEEELAICRVLLDQLEYASARQGGQQRSTVPECQ